MTNHSDQDDVFSEVPEAEAMRVSFGRRRALTLFAGAGLTAVLGGAAALARGGSSSAEAASRSTATTLRHRTTSTTAAEAKTSTTAATTTTTAAATGTSSGESTSQSASATTPTTQPTTAATSAPVNVGAIGAIPQETGGPYPADGTNGPNALTQSGVVRNDIRSSFAGYSGTADGVLLDIELTLVDADTGAVLPGHAVYLWHCDRVGSYSLYGGATAANYLRGVGVADSSGVIRFRSIFPGAYSGRWPHIHFEVFTTQAAATTGRNAVRTSQLALPAAVCQQVYAASGYESSLRNMAQTSLTSDNVFRDGVDLQLATVTGSNAAGYVARLPVGI
jgi:protocatechuate 3,4-dioxygenase beta subunit